MEMLEENVFTVRQFDPDQTSFGEMCDGVDRLRERLGEEFCTACRYCAECPEGLQIAELMEAWQNWRAFGLEKWAQETLRNTADEKQPARCNACGACEKKCPNGLRIQERLAQLSELV